MAEKDKQSSQLIESIQTVEEKDHEKELMKQEMVNLHAEIRQHTDQNTEIQKKLIELSELIVQQDAKFKRFIQGFEQNVNNSDDAESMKQIDIIVNKEESLEAQLHKILEDYKVQGVNIEEELKKLFARLKLP